MWQNLFGQTINNLGFSYGPPGKIIAHPWSRELLSPIIHLYTADMLCQMHFGGKALDACIAFTVFFFNSRNCEILYTEVTGRRSGWMVGHTKWSTMLTQRLGFVSCIPRFISLQPNLMWRRINTTTLQGHSSVMRTHFRLFTCHLYAAFVL